MLKVGSVRPFLEVSSMRCPRCQNLTDAKPLYCSCGYCLDPARRRRIWANLVVKLTLCLVVGGAYLLGATFFFWLAARLAMAGYPLLLSLPVMVVFGGLSLLLFRRLVKGWLSAREIWTNSLEELSCSWN